ncbi:MAG TPA: NDP-sugar synthase [Euzebyales bacterium]
MRAVVLAGGGGTRLRPLTDTVPKPMVEFMGRPFVVGLMLRLAGAGIDHLDLLVGRRTDDFDALVAAGAQVGVTVAVHTEERPLDTAGAARRLLRGSGDRDVLVSNGDQLTDLDYADLVARHRKTDAVATLTLARVADTSSFGVIEVAADGAVHAFIEKPPPGTTDADTVNAGTYVLDAVAFDPFPGDGPLSFERDVFPGLLADGTLVRGEPYDVHWQDLGTPQRFREGCAAVLTGRCAWPLPESLIVGDGMAVDTTARVDPSVALSGPTVVGAGVTVGAGARLHGTVVMHGASVGAGATVIDGIVGPGADVDAGASVGPDAVIVAGPASQ